MRSCQALPMILVVCAALRCAGSEAAGTRRKALAKPDQVLAQRPPFSEELEEMGSRSGLCRSTSFSQPSQTWPTPTSRCRSPPARSRRPWQCPEKRSRITRVLLAWAQSVDPPRSTDRRSCSLDRRGPVGAVKRRQARHTYVALLVFFCCCWLSAETRGRARFETCFPAEAAAACVRK